MSKAHVVIKGQSTQDSVAVSVNCLRGLYALARTVQELVIAWEQVGQREYIDEETRRTIDEYLAEGERLLASVGLTVVLEAD